MGLVLLTLLVVGAFGGCIVMLLREKKRLEAGLPADRPARARRRPGARDFLEFQDIDNGILVLPGKRYRMVLEILGAVNFPLLSAAEQNAVEDSFRSLLLSLQFPVQFYTQTRRLDLTKELEDLRLRTPDLPDSVRRYAEEFAGYLGDWMRTGGVLLRRNYVVISCEADGLEAARQELWRRKELVEGQLRKWLGSNPLSTDALVDVLYVAYNKSRAVSARTSDAAKHGFLRPLVRGGSLKDARAEVEAAAGAR